VTEQSIRESYSTEPHGSTILKLPTFQREEEGGGGTKPYGLQRTMPEITVIKISIYIILPV
jgi:hypothetical protein